MKKLVLLILLFVSGVSYSQAWENSSSNNTVYLGQDENNYPIYKTVNPFVSLGSKIAASVFGVFASGLTTKIIHDRRKERKRKEQEPLLQKNVEI